MQYTGVIVMFCLLQALSAFCQPGNPAEWEMAQFIPELTDEPLLNPGMGLYMQHPPTNLPADHWMMQLSDVAYYRLDWAEVNPEKDAYTFDEYFGPLFDTWVKTHGKRLAFRVMCESTHSRRMYVSPKWIFDAGVPGVKHKGIYAEEQINPVFWDDRYLDLQCEFIAKLGEYLDGREGLEFIDIGSIGEWGEMHLGLHMQGRWTTQMLDETGFTDAKYVMAYRRVIDAFVKAFPNTRVFLNVGGEGNQTINDYAAIRGVHFRQDGLTPSGASANVGEWLYKPYSRRGVICNFEFHSGYREMQQKGWGLRETIDKGLEAPISYLNTNLGTFGNEVPDEIRKELTRAAGKVGYRFVLAKLEHLPTFHVDETRATRIPLSSVWRNDGVAPCYESLALEWTLEDAAGNTVASELSFPRVPTTNWWPGEEQTAATALRLPGGHAPGTYQLTVALVRPETGERVSLGIAGRDAQGRYALCQLQAVAGSAAAGPVYEESFENDTSLWAAGEGMSAALSAQAPHGGDACMVVEGLHKQGWNYASFSVPERILPSARYRLTVWMRVDELQPDRYAPYVKIGASDRDGKWLENYSSDRYDMSKPGTWQELVVTADLPPEAGSVHLAIEKGSQTTPIQAQISIDDVSLELLEGI